MRRDEATHELDPSEVQPTDNSSGTPVDLERLEEAQEGSQVVSGDEQPPIG